MAPVKATLPLFDAYYFATGCGGAYDRLEMVNFFDHVSERIVQDIDPITVLDAGCAMGFLVYGLRKRNVEAFGIDVSEYAISKVDPSIAAYCQVGSIIEPFPQFYNLITCIEVLEHLSKHETEQAIANLCKHTDNILFSSTPFDYKESTHFNVQPPEYWAEQFARQGFFRDTAFNADFITPWAVRFTRRNDPPHILIRDYERRFWLLWKENTDLRELSLEMRQTLSTLNLDKEQTLQDANQEIQTLSRRLLELETLYKQSQALQNTVGWILLKKLQDWRARLAPPGSKRDAFVERFLRLILRR